MSATTTEFRNRILANYDAALRRATSLTASDQELTAAYEDAARYERMLGYANKMQIDAELNVDAFMKERGIGADNVTILPAPKRGQVIDFDFGQSA